MGNKIREFFQKNHYARQVAGSLLSSRWVANNPLYHRLYMARIRGRAARCEALPPIVDIETTNMCNARCVMCAHSQMKREKGFMEFELFTRAVAQCQDLEIRSINLSFYGEPLMDETLAEKISYCAERGIATSFFTNGSLLNEAGAAQFVEAGLDEIIFSLDAFHPEVYERIRVGLKAKRVYDNILGLIALRDSRQLSKPRVSVSMVVFEANRGEERPFRKFWKPKADFVLVANSRNWAGQMAVKGAGRFVNPKLKRIPCLRLWSNLIVLWDGRVTPCCEDYEGQMNLGNIKELSIKEIWQGEKLKRYRKAHMEGRYEEVPLCGPCTYRSTWW